MLHASFEIIGLLVLEKKIFEGFAIYSPGIHLGHVTWTVLNINFGSPFLKMLQTKIEFDWPSHFREDD